MRFIQYLITLVAVATCSNAFSGVLSLSAPLESNDGSYLLRFHDNEKQASEGNRLEIFRNLNGGEYRLILSVPVFKSLSQRVMKNGVYGYKVRWEGGVNFSEPVFVKVDTPSGGGFSRKVGEVKVGSR